MMTVVDCGGVVGDSCDVVLRWHCRCRSAMGDGVIDGQVHNTPMSLYVGHLSPHVRQDELERVFRRFGRCHFQLKDGYGFVVYEVAANAERALRALRGKQICGEQISLNWSNKQPRPFQRPTRGSRFDEPFRRRIFREDDDVTVFRSSQDRRDFATDIHSPSYNHGGRQIDDAPDKEAGHTREDVDSVRENRSENLTGALMDEDAGELNPLELDRWGEPTSDVLPGHGAGKGYDFDRYEPYHGYSKRDEKEGNQRASSDSSPYRLHRKGHREHFIPEGERNFDKSIHHLACYNCGQVGHIKRKCPEGDGRRERFTKFEQTRDEMSFRDKVEGRLKRFQANSWGRPSTSRDPFIARRRTWDRKELHSNNSIRTGSSPERRDKHRSKLRCRSQSKKGTKKKYPSKKISEKKRRAKKASDTSSMSSDSSKSSSGHSHSKSISGSRSHSTSRASSRSHPASSRSRSVSDSSYAKSKISRSRSKSLSRSKSMSSPLRSLSLSISLGRKSSSSPKNIEGNVSITNTLKNNSEHMECLESKHTSKMTNSEVKTLKDANSLSPLGVETQFNAEYSGKNSVSAYKSDLKTAYNETDACFDLFNGVASASGNYPETSALQNSLMMKPAEKAAVDPTTISTGEMLSALHHYGLVSHKEDELDISVEGYFGAARLWPWEMIYYRRLKRGPISTENYAKRLEQNREFGIVDKYIRSSSGWGERQRNP
ncbi:hypothetical protein IEQ34_021694 [Dendrobium chrysotoxum]|uniref:Uncharacterized protein n=1 Tax=Dendrobium chrysotoxum TaxID=161865 RepID=A0AAV7G483_DENCH|nr:hypothetical protein IEQ34_021694 [Dendrobium chrysotoxum]